MRHINLINPFLRKWLYSFFCLLVLLTYLPESKGQELRKTFLQQAGAGDLSGTQIRLGVVAEEKLISECSFYGGDTLNGFDIVKEAKACGINSFYSEFKLYIRKKEEDFVRKKYNIAPVSSNDAPKSKELAPPNVIYADCSDLGGENGWGAWKGRSGTVNWGAPPTWSAWSTPPPATSATHAFDLTTAGTDVCTPGLGGPALPFVAPGFGNRSIRLGLPWIPNNGIEQLSCTFVVSPQDTNFVYAYAIFLDNPNDPSGHVGVNSPHAEIYMLDANNDTIKCSHQIYYGSNTGALPPGFFKGNCWGTGYDNAYKPWTIVGVNLSKYLGKSVTIVITNSDCTLGAHSCYSYWDFRCETFTNIPPMACAGQVVTITAPSDPQINYTYQWYHNGGIYTGAPNSTSQTINPVVQPGDTFVVEVKQPSGCNFKLVYVPTVKSIQVSASAAPSNCASASGSATATVTSGSPGYTYQWSNGQIAQTASGLNPGVYTVTVTDKNGCQGVATATVTGSGSITASVGPSNTLCAGGTVTQVLNASGGINYVWSTGATTTSISVSPSVTTTYSVIVSAAGCSDTADVTITINPRPVAVPAVTNVCFNNGNVFTDKSVGNATITNWSWNFGDGNTSNVQNPVHTYGTAGTFTATLIVTNNSGCKDTSTVKVVVNPLPLAGFSTTPVCLGNPTCFKDLSAVTPGTVTGWSWNFGDPASGAANTSSQQNPCHTYNGNGSYTVILTATSDSGCQNTIMLPATTHPLPTAGIVPKNVCVGSSTTISDGSTSPSGTGNNINSWNWNFGDGSPNSTQQNPSHVYTSAGTYTMTLIVTTQNGCKDTTTNIVQIYYPPVANFIKPVSGCSPVYANYTDLSTSVDGTVNSWQWSFPGGVPVTSTNQNPANIKYVTPGVYSVLLHVTTTNGCTDSILLPMVEVYDWPQAEFCVAPSIAPTTDPRFAFCDMWTQNVSNWVWNFGDGSPLDSINTDPIHSYSTTANQNDFYNYTICLNVRTQHGCWDTVCHSVELIPEFTFYIPNTFTPNADGTNDLFFGKCRGVKEYDIWLFDRWGNQIWDCHHDDKNTNWDSDATTPRQEGLASYCKWDGVVVRGGADMGGGSGDEAQEDVYVWKVKLTDIFNKQHTYVGHVSVVK